MKQSLQLKMGQHLTMTPQLQQAIRLLQLSTLDLQQEIQEIIDTDFAGTDQRGIFRDIPDVESIDYVHSPYAPDSSRVLSRREKAEFSGNCFIGQRWTCLRIGEPDINNYGLHRYIIDYQLKPGTLLGENQCGLSGNTICWNGIPELWQWDIKSATIQIQYPYILNNITCGEIQAKAKLQAIGLRHNTIRKHHNRNYKNINSRTGFFVLLKEQTHPPQKTQISSRLQSTNQQ